MNLIEHINRMRKFSLSTFGPGARAKGVCEHIRSELDEIETEPNKVDEWCDVILLALDGAWRQGFTSEEIASAIEAKQTKNEGRNWPDWRNYGTGEAIEHIKETAEGCYEKGSIIRYDIGPTALMRIDSVTLNCGAPGDHRYYGDQCYGGTVGCYHRVAKLASAEDLAVWRKCRGSYLTAN